MTLNHSIINLAIAIFTISAQADFKPQVVNKNPVTQTTAAATKQDIPKVLSSEPVPVSSLNTVNKPNEIKSDGSESDLQGSPSGQDLNALGDDSEYYNGPSGIGGQYYGPGVMQRCDSAPQSAETAYNEAKTFRTNCGLANRGSNQRIAVSDYSTRPSYMYIFDLEGKCLGKTMVAYGNGAQGAQVACSDGSSHLTPPGFHLTSFHDGSRYGARVSLGLVGLQGQGSVGRGVIIHPARAPGTSSTWGCSGVGYSAFNAVKKTLGFGALVYNYFPPQQMSRTCQNKAGMSNFTSCRLDSGGGVPSQSTGEGTPSITQLYNFSLWLDAAFAESDPVPPREKIKKGTEITIREHKPSGAFEITMTKEEAQGPNIARAEDLKSALQDKGTLKDFKKRMLRDDGAIYVLKTDLPLLWEEEVYRLKMRRKDP